MLTKLKYFLRLLKSILRILILAAAPLLFVIPARPSNLEELIIFLIPAYLFWGFAIHCTNRGFREGNALLDKLDNLDRISHSLDEINLKLDK